MSERDRAIHEAAHAVACCTQGVPFDYVTIMAEPGFLASVHGVRGPDMEPSRQPNSLRERARVWKFMKVLAAGGFADALLEHRPPFPGPGSDFRLARHFAGQLGSSEAECDAILKRLDTCVKAMVRRNESAIRAVADKLIERKNLTMSEVLEITRGSRRASRDA